mgnify:CR=1 FL=1
MNNQKVVIVTGGNKGIGLGITKSFVDAGYHVYIGAREEIEIEEKYQGKVFFQYTDVKNESDHIKLLETVIDNYGKIDCYINNAGFSEWRPIEKIDDDFLSDILNTNLKGAFWGCKAASKVLKQGSSIINISSIAGKRGSANNSAYVASKFGMNGLTQSLAKELGKRGIRVNAICPVLISTDGLLKALDSEFAPGKGNPEKFIHDFTQTNSALNRMPTAKEIGNFCVFLASDMASAITGQCINVDCGVLPQ